MMIPQPRKLGMGMGMVVRFPRRHGRAPTETSTGHKSGLNSPLGTPVSRSIGSTYSADTPLFERSSQYQICDCVVPMRSARGFCPPAISQARLSASFVMPNLYYANFGNLQLKNMSKITNIKFGKPKGMREVIDPIAFGRRVRERRKKRGLSQSALGEQSGYSQQNVGWFEKGDIKDPRAQAQDLAGPLQTTVEWLLFGTGLEERAPPPLTGDQVAENYEKLPQAEREVISDQIMKFMSELGRKRRSAKAL